MVETQTFWKQNILSHIPFKTNKQLPQVDKMKPLKKILRKLHRRNFNSETREKLLVKGTVEYSGNGGRNEQIV